MPAQTNSYPILQLGSEGTKVEELQRLLMPRLPGPDRFPVNGIFDSETEHAVETAQYQFFLKQTGIADEMLWKSLYAKAPVNKPVLRRGTKHELVAMVQEVLKDNGLYGGAVDGDFGAGTETAIKNVQRTRRLTVDGVIGNQTWKALCDIATFVTVN
ncbi:MAG: peptidoglycan-binding protein [Calothrix sp. FI2-JRJ7]|jgi:peptidoglycan hydrolase-like protein with peptidoglycan-binding domain|nr:peptidoglycan-binding protein [Calothrix sp. FI2-JRJ7]